MPGSQAKLAAGEGVFKGFDPTTDPTYLSSHEYNTIELGRRYRHGYQESGHDEVFTVAQVARGEQLVRPTNRAEEEDTYKNQASTVLDNDLVNDIDLQIGGKDKAGMDRVKRKKHRRGAAEFMKNLVSIYISRCVQPTLNNRFHIIFDLGATTN